MVVLFVGLPAVALAQLPLLREGVVDRIPAYLGSALMIALLGTTALALGVHRFGPEGLGLAWPGLGIMVVGTGALLVTAGLLTGGFWLAGRIWNLSESPILRELLPQTGREKGIFAGLSLCAGLGEELAYRGYAMAMITTLTHSPGVALLSANVGFALVHAYQGVLGVLRTYLLGVALGVSLLATGSLWPAIVAHALIDLIGGLLLGERLLGSPETTPARTKGMTTDGHRPGSAG